jgi:hypothetical protein
MKRREDNHLLQALESAVSECRRLEGRIQELEEELQVRNENAFYNEEKKRYDNRPKRQRRRNRTYRPWQQKEEQKAEPQPEVEIKLAHRRSVDDIYREQKQKHESRAAREAANAAEQERLADEAYEASQKNQKPVEVRFSDAKTQLLIEAGKAAMNNTGN